MNNKPTGLISSIVNAFLQGPLSSLVIIIALLLGGIAIFSTPREEEPQIIVPTADVSVSFPGHSPSEVEQLVTRPLEKLLWQIKGVEHVYSISKRDKSLATVRFYVGEDREKSIVKLRDKIDSNKDIVPPGVKNWIIKPVEIDDVPIVTLTVFSDQLSPFELRRLSEELKVRLEKIENISKTQIFGGRKREVKIEPDIEKMASMNIALGEIAAAVTGNNISKNAGQVISNNHTKSLLVNNLFDDANDIKKAVILNNKLRPDMLTDVGYLYKTLYGKETPISCQLIRIGDVAKVYDGPADPVSYVTLGFGPASRQYSKFRNKRMNAVTLGFSKKKGTNAVSVANNIINEANRLKSKILPDNAEMIVTRNYGKIADDKVNSLIQSMIFAIITVVVLLYFTIGWRESLVVGLAVPVSFAMALFANYLFGYTINRVTLFALILSLGLVVDDPITNVDNIQRHIKMGKENALNATLSAVQEVLPPVIMSTLAIIISFTPMFFITGMMGPYMGPMAVNVPLTVTFSTFCALTFVPWVSYKLLKNTATSNVTEHPAENSANLKAPSAWIGRFYKSILSPLLNKKRGIMFLTVVFLMLLSASALLLLKVPLKMLPYDNKDELQLIVDLPEGSSLEKTDRFTQELEQYLRTLKEVKDFETYSGINSPVDFNGLIRRYSYRKNSNNADIRINLAPKSKRSMQSHGIALRIRKKITEIAKKYGAKVKIVEVPPGPPVISTLTAEIKGDEQKRYSDLIRGAKLLQKRMHKVDPVHIVEIDDKAETPHSRLEFKIDKAKLAAHNLTAEVLYRNLRFAVNGGKLGIVHKENERNPLMINLILPLQDRSSINRLGNIWIKNRFGKSVQLSELGKFVKTNSEQPIYHKDLERVVYVTAECAGLPPGNIIIEMLLNLHDNPLPSGITANWNGEGEWHITLRVFRDLGIAFGIALIGIYLLMTVQMKNLFMPLIVMMAIPLTIIGIAPGFYLLNLFTGEKVGSFANPVFFTATAMIGMIALGGIVIRNSIVLIEFVQDSVSKGKNLKDSLIESGTVRFRPIVLTAVTTMLGAWPITFDPVFSGLAWALIFGLMSSTVFTLIVIPVVYFLITHKKYQ
ncbi:MAG: efflux RND transporter permease subunit [Victivallales bacterium]|nr:efflux RND transporter permease subunit [Victivallales bacterium]